MKNDPIVAEVRSIRDELAAQCGYDIKEIFRKLREQQAESGLKYVRYPARRVALAEDVRASNADRKTG
ncbi:MAG: hypothetical protein F4Z57_12215 [Gemmatimonadetes bacterium]|nr:hypothetical protein [Gemmatimonadota bacterium]MYC74027.1 hypothetical protein [Gemmatimonadota bacterium]MYI61856.1 hypothetical protein [Gemmatimonadota bacterium]